MKKLFMISASFLTVASATVVNAQNNLASANDKLIAYTSTSKTGTANAAPASKSEQVNGLVLNRFKINFPGVTDDTWSKTDDGFMVTFTFNAIQNRAYLSKQGDSKTIIRYYTEKELPAAVRRLVITNNYDFFITLVREVSCHNSIVYLVTIEDKTSWKVIRILNEEMDVWEEHIKS